LHEATLAGSVGFVKQLGLEATMDITFPALRIELTQEEILEDLLYPDALKEGVR
jgi:hypothetical protein